MSKDVAASGLIPPSFRGTGLSSLEKKKKQKNNGGLLQRPTGLHYKFLLSRTSCKIRNVWPNAQVKGAIVASGLSCHLSDITKTKASEGSWHQGTCPVKKSKELPNEEYNHISFYEIKTSFLSSWLLRIIPAFL